MIFDMCCLSKQSRPVVLISTPFLTAVSGITTHVRLLQNSTLTKSYDFVHFVVGSEGREETVFGKLARLFVSPWQLMFKIARYRPALFHINTSFNRKAVWRDFIYMLVAKVLGTRVVYQIHGGCQPKEFCQDNRLVEFLVKKMLVIPDTVVLLVEAERRPYQEFSPIKRLEVIPNAVDLAEFRGSSVKAYDAKIVTLVYIGRLVEGKGVQDTIKAMAILRDDYERTDVRFVVAGTGPYEADLKQLAVDLKLKDAIEFRGPIFGQQKRKFWECADLFVFPTFLTEGLPYSLLEALASATPVVVTAVGAMKEVVEDGKQGFFVPPQNPECLAKTLCGLLEDRAVLRKMSREALQRAFQSYGIQQLTAGFERVYGKLVLAA